MFIKTAKVSAVIFILFFLIFYFYFLANIVYPWQKDEAIKSTIEMGGLSELPKNIEDIIIEKRGGIFSRQFIIEFTSDEISIQQWINNSKRLKNNVPKIKGNTRVFEIYPGEKGASGGRVGLGKMGFDAKAINKFTGILDWNFSSKDPLVGDVANSIDGALGKGSVQDVGKKFKSSFGDGDVDIAAGNYNIEVKTGKKMKLNQSLKNAEHAGTEGKGYILYYPEANDAHIREANKNGITIITSLEVLIRTINGK